MYEFKIFDFNTVNVNEYENISNKNLFCTVKWLSFLKTWRHVDPIIIRINDSDNNLLGFFTAALLSIGGFKILGSPFYGWMGQHMGFDFVIEESTIKKSSLLDELIEWLKISLKPSFIIFTDFKFTREDVEHCNTKLIFETNTKTYMLDLTQSEEQIFKNFKSGYRTCVRKFEKLGGQIEVDYSDEFIRVHHEQLADVFGRKGLTYPDYRDRMNILFNSYRDMVLPIKALDENGNNIASSYYLGGGTYAFFASNASFTESLKYNANQALMWYAIRYWKSKGLKTMDLAGGAAYKENFGSVLFSSPTIVWAKHRWQYRIVMWLRNTYYAQFRVKYRLKKMFNFKGNE